MIGMSDEQYQKRMDDVKRSEGVATKKNIEKVVDEIKNRSQEHFGYDFDEIENFDVKNIRRSLNNFMKKQEKRPEGLNIGIVRRGRKRAKRNCKKNSYLMNF